LHLYIAVTVAFSVILPTSSQFTKQNKMLLSKTVLPNKTWTLRSFPEKQFCATENAELLEEDLDLKNGDDDKIIVEVHAVSIDAFIRTVLDSNQTPPTVVLD